MARCFNPRTIALVKPIERTGEILTHVNVPCGRCGNCIIRRRMEWCFRMEEEMKVSKIAYFVTLTYDPENVVWDKYGNMVLVKTSLDSKRFFRQRKGLSEVPDKYLRKMKMKDHGWRDNSAQGYIKRLRITQERCKSVLWEHFYNSLLPSDKMKYFLVGEYGERFGRPHLHMIVFNGCRKLIDECWGFGDVQVKECTSETIAYCTKYMDKWRDKKQDWSKPKEFNVQSEGLGKAFAERMAKFYKENLEINFCMNGKGIMIPMPRYLRYKMLSEYEIDTQIGIINKTMKKLEAEEMRRYGAEEYHRRKKREEEVVRVKMKGRKRDM